MNKNLTRNHWEFKRPSIIINAENGFEITLLAGSWIMPKNLDVKAAKGYPKERYARQIREGINYAKSATLANPNQ
tara:strand:- start:5878 stop:6102 length:225 start_codon:yes stop_codon:yes gene_type:complete